MKSQIQNSVNSLDLCRDTKRRCYIERAAEETCPTKDLIKPKSAVRIADGKRKF
ncbi:MAG: hypothetical protein WCJ66_07345 [Verrucomicrobiota bacterium]